VDAQCDKLSRTLTVASVSKNGALDSTADRGQTDSVTTPTRAGFRSCGWPRPRHAARFAALARSSINQSINQSIKRFIFSQQNVTERNVRSKITTDSTSVKSMLLIAEVWNERLINVG